MELIPPVENPQERFEARDKESILSSQQEKNFYKFVKVLSDEQLHRLAKNMENGTLPASPDFESSDFIWAATEETEEAHELFRKLKETFGERGYKHFKSMDLKAALDGHDVRKNRFLNELHLIVTGMALKRGIFSKGSSENQETSDRMEGN